MIKLQIIGNLGKDCIMKEVNGKTVINFSVANTERFKDSTGNLKERTTWVECAYWTDRTAVAQYLKKGKTVFAEGAPEAEAYTNKENQPAATLRMRVFTLQLIGGNDTPSGGALSSPATSSNNSTANHAPAYASASSVASAPAHNDLPVADDLPF